MNKIIILLSLIFINFNLLCQETNENKVKIIEFSIGAGVSQSLILMGGFSKEYRYAFPEEVFESSTGYFMPFGYSCMISIPVSISLYPLNNFGIGLTCNFGFNLLFVQSLFPYYYEFITTVNILNKFGDINMKKFVILEYGLIIINTIETNDYAVDFDRPVLDAAYIAYVFSLGPNIFLGYETINKKNFSFSIGGNFNAVFNVNRKVEYKDAEDSGWYFSYKDSVKEQVIYNLRVGIECRFRYSFWR